MKSTRRLALLIAGLLASSLAFAQRPARNPAGPPPTPRAEAPVDFVGEWVSVVSEDWRWRMMTPSKGDYTSIPLNAAARAIGETWDPAHDEAIGEACRAYAAPAIMRVPGRVRFSWQDDYTMKLETDSGMQTRVFQFQRPDAPALKPQEGTPRSWQGFSVAEWEPQPKAFTGGGVPVSVAKAPPITNTLEVHTTDIRPGYLRKNGVPFSADTQLTEYFDMWQAEDGNDWFTVTTVVRDPQDLTEPYVITTDFEREPNDSKWDPMPCSAR